jgi:hypothetical protein
MNPDYSLRAWTKIVGTLKKRGSDISCRPTFGVQVTRIHCFIVVKQVVQSRSMRETTFGLTTLTPKAALIRIGVY